AVDGINNVLQVMEEIEYGKMNAVEFIEFSACISGCSGGALNIENPFLASRRIAQQSKKAKVQESNVPCDVEKFSWQKEVTGRIHSGLDDDFEEAMKKMERMDELCKKFPKLDCGSCGAPSCKALAEDIVRGYANDNDCVFIMRKKVNKLAKKLFELNEDFEASKK
ncbi:MAG: ferredoxin, partial [Clostridia bacterium]|nr:ferredoxin [Clostridia bacterium]